jgi:hypothetical protein
MVAENKASGGKAASYKKCPAALIIIIRKVQEKKCDN